MAVAGFLAIACSVALAGAAAAGSFSEYLFPGGANLGPYEPSSGLIVDAKGNLWGTTSLGGSDDNWAHEEGTIFKLVPPSPGQQNWSGGAVFSFGPDGAGYYPNGSAPLGLTYKGADTGTLYDGKSPLYGWTASGGSDPDARNVLFAYGPGRCGFSLVHTFHDLETDNGGYDPRGLTVGSDGAVYGVIASGPTANDTGAVFRMAMLRHGCTAKSYKLIYTFTDTRPDGPIVFGPDGALYLSAGATIYRLEPKSDNLNGRWKRTPLYTFTEYAHGPSGHMVFGSDGALYGADPGDYQDNTAGTIYRLRQTTKHNGKIVWVRDTLFSFPGNDPQGNNPTGVFFGRDGVLYGITKDNYSGGYGTVFKVTPQAGNPDALPWNMTLLHAFSGTDGSRPTGTLAFGSDGAIYGATVFGSPTYPDDYIHGYAYQLVP